MPSAARAMIVAPLRSAMRSGLSSKLPVVRFWIRPIAPFDASRMRLPVTMSALVGVALTIDPRTLKRASPDTSMLRSSASPVEAR